MGRPRGERVTIQCKVCGAAVDLTPSEASRLKSCGSPECRKALPTVLAKERALARDATLGIPDLTPPSARRIQKREVRKCTVCSSQFAIAPKAERLTCSASCDAKRRGIARRKYSESLLCGHCGAEVRRRKAQGAQRFCSDECRLAALNAVPRQAATVNCRICGSSFKSVPSHRKPNSEGKTRGLYCSRKCMWTDDDYRKRRAARHSPSKLEIWLFKVLDEQGVPYERFATVGRYVPDALLPGRNIIFEVDGVRWHRERIAYDRQRDADLAAAGFTVLHFTDLELTSLKATRILIGSALEEISAGVATYRAPLLWRARLVHSAGTPIRPPRTDQEATLDR